MNLSIRNQLPGTVTALTQDEAMATVKVTLAGGQHLTAAITREAGDALALTAGSAVHALVKSTEVALSTAAVGGVSVRNQLAGTVAALTSGGAVASVKVEIEGAVLTSVITSDALADLGLKRGSAVVALIKSTEVSLATS